MRSLGAFLVLIMAGCGGPGNVSGKVTFNNKPVVVGTVVILASDSLPYTGNIGDSGEFLIPRVPPGPAQIAVVSRSPATVRPRPPRPGIVESDPAIKKAIKSSPDKWFPIPERYAQPGTSNISLVVKAGLNEFDIVLTNVQPKAK